MLVVRITANGRLENSKPCAMCLYMMQLYGIYRVYYSNDKGEICCQQVNNMIHDDPWMSKGLFQMKEMWGTSIRSARLPLMNKHKTLIITHDFNGSHNMDDLSHNRSRDRSDVQDSPKPNKILRR